MFQDIFFFGVYRRNILTGFYSLMERCSVNIRRMFLLLKTVLADKLTLHYAECCFIYIKGSYYYLGLEFPNPLNLEILEIIYFL
jgi:hypothetical protein